MVRIETTAEVTPEGKLTVAVPPKVTPGEHWVVVTIDDEDSTAEARKPTAPLKLKMLNWSAWPKDCAFRREDMYGDDGR